MTSKFDLLITVILSAIIILVLAYSASASIIWYDNYPGCTVVGSYTTDTTTPIQLYAATKNPKNYDDHAGWFWFAPEVVDDSPTGSNQAYFDHISPVKTTGLCKNANDAECYSFSHTLETKGAWTVHVYFYLADEGLGNDNGTITVTSNVPEFPFGPAIVIVIPGFIYFVMRKRIKIDRLNHGKN